MKHNFITAIVSAVMLSASFAAHAAQSWIVTDTAPGDGEPVTTVEGITFTPCGVAGVTSSFSSSSPAVLPDGTEIVDGYYGNNSPTVEGYTPVKGVYYKFDVTTAGRLTVAINTNSSRRNVVVSSADALVSPVDFSDDYNPELSEEGYVFFDQYYGTAAWEVEAGKTYYIYSPSSRMRVGGFHFADAASPVKDNITVNVASPGTFAQTFLSMTDKKWNTIRSLKITGALSDVDLSNVKNVSRLKYLDMTEATFPAVPERFMEGHKYVYVIKLPSAVDSVGRYAFRYCERLDAVSAPSLRVISAFAFSSNYRMRTIDFDKMEIIGESAFSGCLLKEISLKTVKSIGYSAFMSCEELTFDGNLDAVTEMGGSAFGSCLSITSVSMKNLARVPNYAFNSCNNLTSVILGESLAEIEHSAFSNCSSLTEITLPATLKKVGNNVFQNSGIKKITCPAVVPPSMSSSSYLYNSSTPSSFLAEVTLYVPGFAIGSYRTANGWKTLFNMEPTDIKVEKVIVDSPVEINTDDIAGAFAEYPDFGVYYNTNDNTAGSIEFTGSGKLQLGRLGIASLTNIYYSSNSGNPYNPAVINRGADISLQAAGYLLTFYHNGDWAFISLPYDVKVADIIPSADTDWVVRGYDGASRSKGEPAWKDMKPGDVLKGGKGYIYITKGNSYYDLSSLAFSSTAANINNLVRCDDARVELEEHVGEFEHNRSWNLVGNPYQAYYSLSHISGNFTAPITIWSDYYTYKAVSPIDDNYVLHPNEAFFVQRPAGTDHILFPASGRYSTFEAAKEDTVAVNGSRAAEVRDVFDFNISGDERARVVFNDAARGDYEVGRDASKFFSNMGTELYVIGSGASYAIDERPAGDCKAIIGVRSSEAATRTLTLSGRHSADWEVEVTDLKSGETATLGATGLDFRTEAGESGARFEVRFKNPVYSGIVDAVMPEDGSVRVYTVDGILLHEGTLDSFAAPAKGLYIVKGAGKASKIFIK